MLEFKLECYREEAPLYSGGGGVGATPHDPLHGNLIFPG